MGLGQNLPMTGPQPAGRRCHSPVLGQGRDKKRSKYVKIQLEDNFQVLKSERSQSGADICCVKVTQGSRCRIHGSSVRSPSRTACSP